MIEERVALAPLTTFGVGGAAERFIEVANEEELKAAASFARGGFFILGGGSNVFAPDEGIDALVIKMGIEGIAWEELPGGRVRAIAGAGHSWDAFVREAAQRGLWGVENLAGIPGTTGGAVVQNIGAYGAELASVFDYADTLSLTSGKAGRIARDAAAFGYRESVFKGTPALAITKAAFVLSPQGEADLSYADLRAAYERGEPLATPEEVGEAVRRIRARKFPDLSKEGTAGSFFKNPVVPEAKAKALKATYPELPCYPQEAGVKLSLAWLLDHALALKGFVKGSARLFERQPLVIVCARGGRAKDIEELAQHVERVVEEKIGIKIEREVIHMHPQSS